MTEPLRDARRMLAVGALLTLLFVCLHAGVFLTFEETFSHDTRNWLPIFSYLYDGLKQGTFPFWSPYTLTGEPFYLIPPTLRLYDPLALLSMKVLGWLGVSSLTAYHLDILRRAVLFAFGASLLLSRFCRDRRVPVLGYGILLFSSLSVGAFRAHDLLLVPYAAPWFLWAFHLWWERPKDWPRILGLAWAFGTSVANYKFVYCLFFYAAYVGLWWAFAGSPAGLSRGGWIRRAATAAGVVAVLVSPWIDPWLQRERFVPVLRLASGSALREGIVVETPVGEGGAHARGFDFAGLAVPGVQLGHFLPIVPCSEALSYLGAMALPGAALALLYASGPARWVWGLLAAACGWMAVGPAAGLAAWVYALVPGFGFVRNLQFFMPFTVLLLFLLWGVGMDVLLRGMGDRSRRLVGMRVVAAAVVATFLLAGGITARHVWKRSQGPFPSLPGSALDPAASVILLQAAAAGLLIAWIFWVVRGRGGNRGLLALGILAIAELGLYQIVLRPYLVSERARFEAGMRTDFPFSLMRVKATESGGAGLEEVFGYAPLWTREAAATLHPLKHFIAAREYLDLRAAAPDERGEEDLLSVSLPVLRFVPRVREMPADAYLAALKGPEGADLARQVVVHDVRPGLRRAFSGVIGPEEVTGSPGVRIEVVAFGPDRLTAIVSNPEPGFLFYGDAWHPDWQVEGSRRNVVRANHAYKGVFLQPGPQRVTFRFRPRAFIAGLAASLVLQASFLCIATSWLAMRWRKGWEAGWGQGGRRVAAIGIAVVVAASFLSWKKGEAFRGAWGLPGDRAVWWTFLVPVGAAFAYQWGFLRIVFPRSVAALALAAGAVHAWGGFHWGLSGVRVAAVAAVFGGVFHFLRFARDRGMPGSGRQGLAAWLLACLAGALGSAEVLFGGAFLTALWAFRVFPIRLRDMAWLASGVLLGTLTWKGTGPGSGWEIPMLFVWPPSGRSGLGGLLPGGQDFLGAPVGVFSQCVFAVVLAAGCLHLAAGRRHRLLGDTALGGRFLALFLGCAAWAGADSRPEDGVPRPWEPGLLAMDAAWAIACVGGCLAWKWGMPLIFPFLESRRERRVASAAGALLLSGLIVVPFVGERQTAFRRANLHIPGREALERHKGETFYTNVPPLYVSHYTGTWAVGGLSMEEAVSRDLSRALWLPGAGVSEAARFREPDLFFYSFAMGRHVHPRTEKKLGTAFQCIEVGDEWQIYRMTGAE